MKIIQSTTTHQSGQVTSTGGVADPLDTLARQAQAQENADNADTLDGPTLPGEAEAVPAMTNAQCFAMMLEMVRDVLCSFAKVESPKLTLSSEKIAPAADALGAVADKYGLSLASAAGNYMIEIKAGLIVIPLVLAFRAGLQKEIKDEQAKKKAIEPGAPTAQAVQDLTPQATPHHVVG